MSSDCALFWTGHAQMCSVWSRHHSAHQRSPDMRRMRRGTGKDNTSISSSCENTKCDRSEVASDSVGGADAISRTLRICRPVDSDQQAQSRKQSCRSSQYRGSASLSTILSATAKSATQGIRRRFITWLRCRGAVKNMPFCIHPERRIVRTTSIACRLYFKRPRTRLAAGTAELPDKRMAPRWSFRPIDGVIVVSRYFGWREEPFHGPFVCC